MHLLLSRMMKGWSRTIGVNGRTCRGAANVTPCEVASSRSMQLFCLEQPHSRHRSASARACASVRPVSTSTKLCTRSVGCSSGMTARASDGMSSNSARGRSSREPRLHAKSSWLGRTYPRVTNSSIAIAARRPAATAWMTVAGPVTQSPPAKIFVSEDCIVKPSTSMSPHLLRRTGRSL